jgi:hypothetical protein
MEFEVTIGDAFECFSLHLTENMAYYLQLLP